jgi:hypothetical protein
MYHCAWAKALAVSRHGAALAQAGPTLIRGGRMDEADERYLERVARYSPEVFEEGSYSQKTFRELIKKLLEEARLKPNQIM